MKKTLTFYARKGWEEDFSKGDVWHYPGQFPNLYTSKEHIRVNNLKDWKEIKDNFSRYFQKINITIESV